MIHKNVCVVVLGDIGRSPRMQYHSLSLAENGHKVDVIGYGETPPLEALKAQPLVWFHYLTPYPNVPLPRLLNYIFKTLWQCVSLLFVFALIRRADVIMVQNPPAVPALIMCYIYKTIVRAKLIIDWHNYAHTIMSLSLSSKHPLVKITRLIESKIGRLADTNFCVTRAMQVDLSKNWGISAVTLYDKPQESFRERSLEEKHEVLNCLALKYKELQSNDDGGTVFTKTDDAGRVYLRENRPGLLISSTSWTEDEDFSILLSALEEYENATKNGNPRKLPQLFCIITGKGPLKEYYARKVNGFQWENVHVITPWLESVHYPIILAAADLGVCLHTSSSGLDLPMKVVDMFGCGLSVCAFDFKCINELVKHGENGYVFKTSEELSKQIQNWFEVFPSNVNQHQKKFKDALKDFQKNRWKENWMNVASSAFQ